MRAPIELRTSVAASAARAGFLLLGIFLTVTVARTGGWVAPAALGVVALSLLHPPSGLLMVAGFLPLGSIATGFFQQRVPLAEVLVLSFLGGAALRFTWQRRAPGRVPIAVPLLAAVAVASYAVHLVAFRAHLGPERFNHEMLQLVSGAYFSGSLSLDRLQIATAFLEGLGLFAATTGILAAWPTTSPSFLRCLAAGAGAAAALNVNRLLTIAVATGEPSEALVRLARTLRINVHYPDVNAAGSYFALMFLVTLGVAFSTRGVQRIVWAVVSLVIGSAMGLTSSRAAWLGACASGVLAIAVAGWTAVDGRGRWIRVAPLALVLAVAVAAMLWTPNRLTGRGTSVALQIRRDMAIASFRMLSTAPVFGIGIGRFFAASEESLRDLPAGRYYDRENAHNAFLQILTELGAVGLTLFALLLVAVARRAVVAIRSRVVPLAAYGGAVCGVVAFLISAFLGHPLLTPTVAHAFWMTLGAVAAFGVPPPVGAANRFAIAAVIVVVLLASLPFRASARLRNENLEHVGYGVSGWRVAEDGTRYRAAEREGTVFVPAGATRVDIPLRVETNAEQPVQVSVSIDSRLVNRIHVSGREWTLYRLHTRNMTGRRFVPVTFAVADGASTVLWIGKVVVPGPVQ